VGLQSGVKVPFGNISAHYTSPLDLWIVVGNGFSMFFPSCFDVYVTCFTQENTGLRLRNHWFLFEDTPLTAPCSEVT
jgi:hypothetical protein